MKPDNTNTPQDKSPPKQPSLDDILRQISATTGQPRAEKITGPHGMAAETLAQITATDATALSTCLEADAILINGGALSGVEGKLASQATTLNALFHRLTQFAFQEARTMENFSGYMKLALKAQAQSAQALEMLGNMKQGPRVLVTRQLNAANQQIVNNAPAAAAIPATSVTPAESSRAAPTAKSLSERLRRISARKELPEPSILNQNATLDTRSPSEAASGHHGEQAMDESHRSANP